MNEASYFKEINSITSPLLLLPVLLDKIIQMRTNDLSDTIDDYLSFANQLAQLNNDATKTRAEFIRLQCRQIDTKDFFEEHRKSWGIPKFEEDLLNAADFRNGFLWTFRDHTTSWNEDQEARHWFYTHVEARFVRNWELWSWDNGYDEIVLKKSNNYKNILWALVEGQDYSPLVSPIITRQELVEFYDHFDQEGDNFDKEDLLQIIKENPNW